MGKEDRASLPLMPSCPGEDRDDTSSDQDIAGSHKKTYPEWARLSSLHSLSPWLTIVGAFACVFIKRRYFFGTIGSWDRVLIFSLRMASRRSEEVRSKRCFEFL